MEEKDVISKEEGYELVKRYVHYFWVTGKFYSLKNDREEIDIVDDIYCKFLSKHLFEKYDSSITSKKYFVMIPVKRTMSDMLRKYRYLVSLDKPIIVTGKQIGRAHV